MLRVKTIAGPLKYRVPVIRQAINQYGRALATAAYPASGVD